jgi:hypothetical protein
MPSSQGACVVNVNEQFCAPTASLAGSMVADICSPTLPAGQLEVEWLLPDDATNVALLMSDETTRSYPAGDNVYITRLPLNPQSPIPTAIQWTDPAGQHHTIPSVVPVGAQNANCAHPPA